MIKKISFSTLIILLFFGMVIHCGFAAQDTKVYNWNYHTGYDPTYYVGGSFIQHWADMVWEETNHQLKINIFYSGTLGYKGTEMLSSLSNGLLEAAEFAASTMASESQLPWLRLDDFYALYDNWEQLIAVYDAAAPMIKEGIEKNGTIKVLALYPACPEVSFEGIWMNKTIKKWGDFKGTKVRTYYTAAREYCLDPLGFSSLYLPGAETYQGLKTGLVDGAIQTALAGYTGKYHEIAKYFYVFEPITGNWWGILCGQKAYDALPKDVQEGLVRASKAIQDLLIDEVWVNSADYTPGLAGAISTEEVVKYFEEQGNLVLKVPLLQQKVQEQNAIGIPEWIKKEGGPEGQYLYDVLLKAKEQYPESDLELFNSLPVLNIEE